MAATVADIEARFRADTSQFTSAVQSAHEKVTGFGGKIMGAAGSVLDFGMKLGGSIFAVKSLADGAISLGSSLLTPVAALEQNKIAFTGLLGSATKADAFLRDMQGFAASTPFEFPELVTASQHMLAFGFQAGQIKPMLTSIGDAMAAMGQGGDAVDQVVRIFGQMHAATKLNAGDMMQLTSLGIPAWDMVAKGIGKSVPELQKMVSAGLMPADKAIGILQTSFNKSFGGSMQKQSESFNGLLSTLADNARLALMAFAGPLFDRAKKALEGLGNAVQSPAFQQFAGVIGGVVASALDKVVGFVQGLLPHLTTLATSLQGQIVPAFLKLATFAQTNLLPAIQNIVTLFVTHLLPVLMQIQTVVVTQVIPALVALVTPIITQLAPAILHLIAVLAPVLGPALGFIAGVIGAVLVPVITILATVLGTLIGWIADLIGWIGHAVQVVVAWAGGWESFVATIRNAIASGFAFIRGIIDGAIKFVASLFIWLYNHNTYFHDLVNQIRLAFEAARTFIMSVWSGITSWLGAQFNIIKTAAKAAWDGLVGIIRGAIGQASGAAHGVADAATSPILGLGTALFNAGKKAIQMLIDGIKSMAGAVGKAAGDIAGNITKFLGFHSPTEEGPGADADTWMPNLGLMLSRGLEDQRERMRQSALGIASDVSGAFSGIGVSANVRSGGDSGSFGNSRGPVSLTIPVYIGDRKVGQAILPDMHDAIRRATGYKGGM